MGSQREYLYIFQPTSNPTAATGTSWYKGLWLSGWRVRKGRAWFYKQIKTLLAI